MICGTQGWMSWLFVARETGRTYGDRIRVLASIAPIPALRHHPRQEEARNERDDDPLERAESCTSETRRRDDNIAALGLGCLLLLQVVLVYPEWGIRGLGAASLGRGGRGHSGLVESESFEGVQASAVSTGDEWRLRELCTVLLRGAVRTASSDEGDGAVQELRLAKFPPSLVGRRPRQRPSAPPRPRPRCLPATPTTLTSTYPAA